MAATFIKKEIRDFLKSQEFVNVATCDFNGRPNVAPKFLLKTVKDSIYVADHVIGRTYDNLRINSRVSISSIDTNRLIGYQFNGSAQILDQGEEYEKIVKELHKKEIDFSVERVIQAVHNQKTSKTFELGLPERVVIFKVKIEEAVRILPSGKLERNKLK